LVFPARFAKAPPVISTTPTTCALVAMSGGVDSAVAALLLQRDGFEVLGVHMATSPYAKAEADPARKFGSCCSPRDAADARAVATRAGFAFYVFDLEHEFRRAVIDPFIDDYLHARTPNPCVLCNNKLKLGTLLDRARTFGAEFVATGHYARTILNERVGQWMLARPADRGKDQTYYLFGLTTRQVQAFRCPLGDLLKSEVRALAREFGLPVHDKPESMEICFVPGDDYRAFLRGAVPDIEAIVRPGDIVDTRGAVRGRHTGLSDYTVGQRRGLGIAAAEPLYVVALDTERNVVVVGKRDEMGRRRLRAGAINWQLAPEKFAALDPEFTPTRDGDVWTLRLRAQIRYRAAGNLATVTWREGEPTAHVQFDDPQFAITPGQAVAFYDARTGDWLLGGGWIETSWQDDVL